MRRGLSKGIRALAPGKRPTEPELVRLDSGLCRILERDFGKAAELAGEQLACGPGCSDCCFGPFPVTRLDGWRLRRGLDVLDADEPDRAARIRERAFGAVDLLADGFPGDPASGRLDGDEVRLDRFVELHPALACPALDPRSGCCELYAARPVSCRTYGPPLRFGSEDAKPCNLCFRGAGPGEIERCRIEPDRQGVEQRILLAIGVDPGDEWETLIAHALALPAWAP